MRLSDGIGKRGAASMGIGLVVNGELCLCSVIFEGLCREGARAFGEAHPVPLLFGILDQQIGQNSTDSSSFVVFVDCNTLHFTNDALISKFVILYDFFVLFHDGLFDFFEKVDDGKDV